MVKTSVELILSAGLSVERMNFHAKFRIGIYVKISVELIKVSVEKQHDVAILHLLSFLSSWTRLSTAQYVHKNSQKVVTKLITRENSNIRVVFTIMNSPFGEVRRGTQFGMVVTSGTGIL